METVAFITTETDDDLIVSFALCSTDDDPTEVESLTLLRTPKYELLLEDWERGVKVSFEVDHKGLLEELSFDPPSGTVRLKTQHETYELDVRQVDAGDLEAMCAVLRKMNFDKKVQLSGV